MKTFIQKLGVFGIVIILLFPFFVAIVAYTPKLESFLIAQPACFGFTYKRIPEYNVFINAQKKKKKALIFGSSTAYQGIYPDSLNTQSFDFFNMSSSGQTLTVSRYLIDAIKKSADIELIILDIYPELMDNSPKESVRDLIVNNPNLSGLNLFSLLLESKDLTNFMYYTYFYVKREVFGNRRMDIKDKSLADCDRDFSYEKGFAGALHSPFIKSEVLHPKMTIDFQGNEQINEIYSHCKKNGIKLICVISPEVGNRELQLIHTMDKIVINGNSANLDRSLFYDDHHLRREGALKYSSWLKNQVKSLN